MAVWETIAGSSVTVIGTLAGVFIANKHNGKVATEEKIDHARTELRQLALELADISSKYISHCQGALLFDARFSESDLVEYVNTDSSRRERHLKGELDRVIAHLTALLGGSTVENLLYRIRQSQEEYLSSRVPVINYKKSLDFRFEAMLVAQRQLTHYSQAISDLLLELSPHITLGIPTLRPVQKRTTYWRITKRARASIPDV